MTNIRSRVVVAVAAVALLAAGTVLAAQSFSGRPTATPAVSGTAVVQADSTIAVGSWNETGRKGTLKGP